MTQRDPKLIALLFNERINNLDLEGLVNLMTDDHTFIDSTREAHVGKKEMGRILLKIRGLQEHLQRSREQRGPCYHDWAF